MRLHFLRLHGAYPYIIRSHHHFFVDESKNKVLKEVAALARIMDDSSIFHVPMPIDIFGYDIEAIMLKKWDFIDFRDRKEISVCITLCVCVYLYIK